MPIVNNPGLGNCGFYAFGVGLIDAIQKEFHEKNSSAILEQLNVLVEEPINLEQILSFDLKQYASDYQNYNRSFMDKLQDKLRKVSLLAYQSNLLDEHLKDVEDPSTRVEGTTIFRKFMEIVLSKLDKTSISSDFNELVLSKEVHKIADSVLENLSFNGRKITTEELKKLNYASYHSCLDTATKNIFLADVFKKDNSFNPLSQILAATRLITKSGHWATHDDLKTLASEIGVNLNIDGQISQVNQEDASTITLHNSANVHWTTVVHSIPSLVQNESIQQTKKWSPTAEKILLAMVMSIDSDEKQEKFKDFATLLIQNAEHLEVKSEYKIDIKNIDTAEAKEGQTDEEFAQSLQEAEFRKAGLKR